MDNSIIPALWLHCYYYLGAAEADELCQRMAVNRPHKAGFIPHCSVVEKCSKHMEFWDETRHSLVCAAGPIETT